MTPHPHSRRRPTVPFGEWRISLDLEATRALASAPALARGCECPWCRNWAAAWSLVLPPDVVRGLRRLGIDPACPADLYASDDDAASVSCAVFYYCVGVVRDGPAPYYRNAHGLVHVYQHLRGRPGYLSVLVAPQRMMHDFPFKPPVRFPVHNLVQVEFRLSVPWMLDEENPFVTQARAVPKPAVVWKRGRLHPAPVRRRGRRTVTTIPDPT